MDIPIETSLDLWKDAVALLNFQSDTESSSEEEEATYEKVDHKAYYKKLFPERYIDNDDVVAFPKVAISVEDLYLETLLVNCFQGILCSTLQLLLAICCDFSDSLGARGIF